MHFEHSHMTLTGTDWQIGNFACELQLGTHLQACMACIGAYQLSYQSAGSDAVIDIDQVKEL